MLCLAGPHPVPRSAMRLDPPLQTADIGFYSFANDCVKTWFVEYLVPATCGGVAVAY